MTDDKTRDIFVTGLKNAHAMEKQALSIMKPQVKRIENYPEIAEQLEKHISRPAWELWVAPHLSPPNCQEEPCQETISTTGPAGSWDRARRERAAKRGECLERSESRGA
jgi:hypothetical protein